MSKRKKIKLNMKFNQGKVECARSPDKCGLCEYIKQCETIDTYYYPFQGIAECFKNNEKRK